MTYKFIEAQEKHFQMIWDIAEDSFPINELRTESHLHNVFTNDPNMKVYCLCDDTREAAVQAFIVVWQLEGVSFIEYFAVTSHKRGKGMGGVLLDWTLKHCGQPVILEVEPPEDTLTKRRVRFYEGHGFILNTSFDYKMPPSRDNTHPVPLRIMSYPEPLEAAGFPALRAQIYRIVYNRPDFG